MTHLQNFHITEKKITMLVIGLFVLLTIKENVEGKRHGNDNREKWTQEP